MSHTRKMPRHEACEQISDLFGRGKPVLWIPASAGMTTKRHDELHSTQFTIDPFFLPIFQKMDKIVKVSIFYSIGGNSHENSDRD